MTPDELSKGKSFAERKLMAWRARIPGSELSEADQAHKMAGFMLSIGYGLSPNPTNQDMTLFMLCRQYVRACDEIAALKELLAERTANDPH